jgi:hypothetical protein
MQIVEAQQTKIYSIYKKYLAKVNENECSVLV